MGLPYPNWFRCLDWGDHCVSLLSLLKELLEFAWSRPCVFTRRTLAASSCGSSIIVTLGTLSHDISLFSHDISVLSHDVSLFLLDTWGSLLPFHDISVLSHDISLFLHDAWRSMCTALFCSSESSSKSFLPSIVQQIIKKSRVANATNRRVSCRVETKISF